MTNQNISIFIVDDDPIIRDGLEGLLLSENYRIRFAKNGNEALDMLVDYEPDVILLDVMMPGLDGYDVCQQIKSNPERQHIPIIMLTALNDRASLLRGLESGADEYLAKPVSGLELRARVRSMIRIKQQYDQLKLMSITRSQLVQTLAFDIRTPLNAILLQAELLRNNKLSDERKGEKIKNIVVSVRVIDSMLESVLQVTNAGSTQLNSLLNLGRQSAQQPNKPR